MRDRKDQFAVVGFVVVYLLESDARHAHAIIEPVFKIAKCFGVQGFDLGFVDGAVAHFRSPSSWGSNSPAIVKWPAAFFVGGDKQTAAELSNMKGQMVAVEQASIAKKCNIQFQGERPRGT
jgi:hypothetical protein